MVESDVDPRSSFFPRLVMLVMAIACWAGVCLNDCICVDGWLVLGLGW